MIEALREEDTAAAMIKAAREGDIRECERLLLVLVLFVLPCHWAKSHNGTQRGSQARKQSQANAIYAKHLCLLLSGAE